MMSANATPAVGEDAGRSAASVQLQSLAYTVDHRGMGELNATKLKLVGVTALLLAGLVMGPRLLRSAEEEPAADDRAKWAVDADARKRGIAAVLGDRKTVTAAAYRDNGKRFVVTAAADDGTSRFGLAVVACQELRDARAVSAEILTIVIESDAGKTLGTFRCAHHSLPWRD